METQKKSDPIELKHLGFVRIAALQMVVYASHLYNYAKQHSGPLRSTVATAERAVTMTTNPVFNKFRDVPDHLLVFLDKKVDDGARVFDEKAPPAAKRLLATAVNKVQQLVDEARIGGPSSALHFAAKESNKFAITQSVKVWVKLNQFPVVHTVADMAVPTAAHWSRKYNHFVKDMTHYGYTVFGYLPLVPVDEIARAFKQGQAGDKQNLTD